MGSAGLMDTLGGEWTAGDDGLLHAGKTKPAAEEGNRHVMKTEMPRTLGVLCLRRSAKPRFGEELIILALLSHAGGCLPLSC